jgi:GlpG protein
MRQAGSIHDQDQAQRFIDYLLTQGITAKLDQAKDGWEIWVRDEDQLSQAVKEFEGFVADPDAARYRQARSSAESLRKQQQAEDTQRRRNLIEMRDRWSVSAGGPRPLTFLLMAASVVVTLATDFGHKDSAFLRSLWFQPMPHTFAEASQWGPTADIRHGQVWRIWTPMFVHLSPWHLVFNMYWLYVFGSMIEGRRGTIRLLLLVLACGAASTWGEYFFEFIAGWTRGQPTTEGGGMSGVGYGLFGYLWMKGKFDASSQLFLPPNTVALFLIWLIVCWTGAIGPVANWAHATGLAAGVVIGYAPTAWRKLTGR